MLAVAGLADGAPCAEVTATLERATQELADAVAPGQRTVWEQYTDPAYVYATEDNEVEDRAAVLEDLKPLPWTTQPSRRRLMWARATGAPPPRRRRPSRRARNPAAGSCRWHRPALVAAAIGAPGPASATAVEAHS